MSQISLGLRLSYPRFMNHFKTLSPLGIVLIYTLIASTWLLLSDALIESFFQQDNPWRFYAHVGKGFFNVVWTAVLIYTLTKISMNKLSASRKSEEIYAKRVSNILERISDSFLSVNASWEITYINNHLEEAFGENRDRVIGMNIWEAIPKFSSSIIRSQLETAMKQRITVSFQDRNQRLGLELFFSAYPIDDGIAVYIQDFTKLTNAESSLLQHEKDLQFLIDSIEDNIWSIDAQGNYLSFNQSFAKLYKSYTGVYPIIGEGSSQKLIQDSDSESWRKAYQDCFRGSEASLTEVFMIEGAKRIQEIRLKPLKNGSDEIIGVLAISRDVTDKLINEQTLKRQNELFDEIAWLTSHEIRGPVATIRGLLNIVDRDVITSKENAEMLEHLVECSEQLDVTIKSIIEKVEYAYKMKPSHQKDKHN